MNDTEERELAALLADLRRTGRQQSGLDPRLTPPDSETAYRVAGRVAENLGWAVGGWKIAANKPAMQEALRTDAPIYGRVYTDFILPAPVTVAHAGLCSPIPEVEFVAKLGSDLPPRDAPYRTEEVTDAVESLHPGIEFAECRFVHNEDFPPLPAILADGAGSARIIYGPAIADWRDAPIADQEGVLYCDGDKRRTVLDSTELSNIDDEDMWAAGGMARLTIWWP